MKENQQQSAGIKPQKDFCFIPVQSTQLFFSERKEGSMSLKSFFFILKQIC